MNMRKHPHARAPSDFVRSVRQASAILMLLAGSLLAPGCNKDDDGTGMKISETTNTTDPHWVSQATPPSDIAVVFIHGLFGDTDDTWKHQKTGKSFFDYVESTPGIGDKVDIFAFGFTSKIIGGGSLDIREAANKIPDQLKFHGLMRYDQIVFVTHSMGGLVAMQAVVNDPELSDKTALLVLYATPQQGSQMTHIAKHLVTNNAVRQMTPADGNDYLKKLSDDWVRLKSRGRAPFVTCAYETKPTAGIMIVPWSSATRFCDDVAPGIGDADHLSIVKPDRATHDSIVRFVVAMREHVLPRLEASSWQTPNFTPEDQNWVYPLGNITRPNPATLKNASRVKQRYEITEIQNADLLILPVLEPGKPQEILPGQSATLRFMVTGDLQPEYRFGIKLSSLPVRTVIVRIPDLQVAQAERQAQLASIAQKISSFLGSAQEFESFKNLPDQQKQTTIAGLAKSVFSEGNSGLSESGQWLLATDALTRLGFMQTASAALFQAEAHLPATAKPPSVEHLKHVITTRANIDMPPDAPSLPQASTTVFDTSSELNLTNRRSQATFLDLAERVQHVEVLKSEGLMLEGDVLKARGDNAAAAEAYRDANAIKRSPMLDRKIRDLAVPAPPEG